MADLLNELEGPVALAWREAERRKAEEAAAEAAAAQANLEALPDLVYDPHFDPKCGGSTFDPEPYPSRDYEGTAIGALYGLPGPAIDLGGWTLGPEPREPRREST